MELVPHGFSVVVFPDDPLDILVRAGRVCYQSDKIDESPESKANFVEKIITSGHESVIEHAAASVLVTTGRGVTHEWVRHRIGSAYSQESTRYVRYEGPREWHTLSPVNPDGEDVGCVRMIIPTWAQHLLPGPFGKADLSRLQELGPAFDSRSEYGPFKNIGRGVKVLNRSDKFPEFKNVEGVVSRDCTCGHEPEWVVAFGGHERILAEKFLVVTERRPKVGLREVVWAEAMLDAERHYQRMLDFGAPPQEARGVLPTDLKTQILCTHNFREWRLIFTLRCAKAAHPDIRHVMTGIFEDFVRRCPAVFGDLEKKIDW